MDENFVFFPLGDPAVRCNLSPCERISATIGGAGQLPSYLKRIKTTQIKLYIHSMNTTTKITTGYIQIEYFED